MIDRPHQHATTIYGNLYKISWRHPRGLLVYWLEDVTFIDSHKHIFTPNNIKAYEKVPRTKTPKQEIDTAAVQYIKKSFNRSFKYKQSLP